MTQTIKAYIEAASLYQEHKNKLTEEHLKEIYLKKVSEYYDRHFTDLSRREQLIEYITQNILPHVKIEKDLVLKQALMEVNNALSHLNSAMNGVNSTEDNIKKANTHIQRAVLDCYKAIIKDLTFLNLVDNSFLKELKKLRELEYSEIGSDKTSNRINIANEYKKVVFKILCQHQIIPKIVS